MARHDRTRFRVFFQIIWPIMFICFTGCNNVTMAPVRPAKTDGTSIDTATEQENETDADTAAQSDTVTEVAIDLGAFGPPESIDIADVTVEEDDPTLTADQLEICFESARAGGMGETDIWCAIRETVSSPWEAPQNMVELNTPAIDGGPEISADGLTIWLFSRRSGGLGSEDVWVSTRPSRRDAWQTPVNATELNTDGSELFPNTTPSKLELVLTRRTQERDLELILYTRVDVRQPWGVGVPVVELNTAGRESEGYFADGGRLLAFGSDRPGGAGKSDLYFATRPAIGEPFGPIFAFTALNTANDESDPWISPDLRTIYFSSNQSGTFQIYRATR